jgi:DNA-binding MarR family transcriptional regulator
MDCIDHATTTTRLLRLLEQRGLLRFHRVLEPARRLRVWVFPHYAAQIEEMQRSGEGEEVSSRFAVDSWFFDNGHPAAVMRLETWQKGNDPDDDE